MKNTYTYVQNDAITRTCTVSKIHIKTTILGAAQKYCYTILLYTIKHKQNLLICKLTNTFKNLIIHNDIREFTRE